MGAAAFRQHALQVGRRGFIDQQLARIGAAVLTYRGRLSPNEFRPASAETAIAPERQLIGAAVDRSVAAFHWLDAKRIAGTNCADGDGAKERAEIALEANAEVESSAFILECLPRME